MNIYVWEGVLCDHTCGMIVVRAKDDEEAAGILAADDMVCSHVDRWEEDDRKPKGNGLIVDGMEPYVYGPSSLPFIHRVYGGG